MEKEKVKAYVILEQGWEYNDEYYFRSGSGGGDPRQIYITPEAAQEKVDQENIKEFLGLVSQSYDYVYGKKSLPTGKALHEKALMYSFEYIDHYAFEGACDAMQALEKKSPGLWINKTEEFDSDFCPELSRELTDEEIAMYMSATGVGSTYFQEVEMVYE